MRRLGSHCTAATVAHAEVEGSIVGQPRVDPTCTYLTATVTHAVSGDDDDVGAFMEEAPLATQGSYFGSSVVSSISSAIQSTKNFVKRLVWETCMHYSVVCTWVQSVVNVC